MPIKRSPTNSISASRLSKQIDIDQRHDDAARKSFNERFESLTARESGT